MAVYLIRAGEDGPVKIGRSACVDARLRALQTAHPAPLSVLRLIEGDRAAERWMHDRFAELRERGEWYRFAPAMLTVEPDAVEMVKVERQTVASRVIAKFGGTRKAAAKGGWPPSTVQNWVESGLIPARRQAEVLEAGKDLRDPVAPADFFDPPSGEAAD